MVSMVHDFCLDGYDSNYIFRINLKEFKETRRFANAVSSDDIFVIGECFSSDIKCITLHLWLYDICDACEILYMCGRHGSGIYGNGMLIF